ncbi:MAG: uracil-DNA glycosylase family protein [Aquificota bacterium]|nr:uracil-DNA glycosylase family protein [Aquificota bacterium]
MAGEGPLRDGLRKQAHIHPQGGRVQTEGAYITAVVRCVPPENRPTPEEIENCNPYLIEELTALKNLRVILCLGSVALSGTLKALRRLYPDADLKGIKFGHSRLYTPRGLPYTLITSYHPSRQNTQTGRLRWDEWLGVFRRVREVLG